MGLTAFSHQRQVRPQEEFVEPHFSEAATFGHRMGNSENSFFVLLMLNCLQLKILMMPKGHVLGWHLPTPFAALGLPGGNFPSEVGFGVWLGRPRTFPPGFCLDEGL